MGSRTVEAAGVDLAVRSSGEGPATLLVHGAGLAAEALEPLAADLVAGHRVARYDRRAYGSSEPFEAFRGTTISEQSEDAVAVIEALDLAPVLLVGIDVGAVAALDLALRHRALVRAAVLVEPPLLSLVPAGREETAAIRDVVEAGARDGGPGGAVDAYLEHVGGEGVLERLGFDRTEAARRSARPLAADLAAAPAWRFSPRDLRALALPVVVVSGARSAPARRAAASALVELLPGASPEEIDAGHLVALDDPEGLARAVGRAGL